MKILVLANCQQGPIASILRSSGVDAVPAVRPIHQISDADLPALHQQIASSDIVVLQHNAGRRFADLGLDVNSVRRIHGQVVVVPNIYFAGYHPTFASSSSYDASSSAVTALLDANAHGPHLDTLPLAAIDLGIEQDLMQSMLASGDYRPSAELSAIALSGLLAREGQCDIRISDWLQDRWANEVLFFSFNHPVNSVMAELCRRVMWFLGADVDIKHRSTPYLSNYRLPVYPAVSAVWGVSGDVHWPIGGGANDHDMKIDVGPFSHLGRTYGFFSRSAEQGSDAQTLSKVRASQPYDVARTMLSRLLEA